MKVVDTNLLIYAVNSEARQHSGARAWLDNSLNVPRSVGFTWLAMLGFVRIVTHPKLFPNPYTISEAWAQINTWLTAPGSVLLDPGPSHMGIMVNLLEPLGKGGNLINDAHLAAIALEHRAEIASYDRDFDLFSGVTRTIPIFH